MAALGQPGFSVVIYNSILSRFHESIFKKLAALATLPGGAIAALFILYGGFTGRAPNWFFPSNPGPLEFLRTVYLFTSVVGGAVVLASLTINPRRRRRPAAERSNHSDVVPIPRQSPLPWGMVKRTLIHILSPINQVHDVEIITKEVNLPNLPPAFDGLRLAHITDLHVDRSLEDQYYQKAIQLLLEQKPDVVVMTGDYVSRSRHIHRLSNIFEKLKAPLGVYFVRGNHDFWTHPKQIRHLLEGLGFICLNNRSEILRRGDDAIALVGVEHPWGGRIQDWELIFPPNLPPCRIALVHTPDVINPIQRQGCDLALAGHTHGGQIQFPWIGATLVPSNYGRRYAAGWRQIGKTLLYTNRGLGAFFPIRMLCRPEIAVFILRHPHSPDSPPST